MMNALREQVDGALNVSTKAKKQRPQEYKNSLNPGCSVCQTSHCRGKMAAGHARLEVKNKPCNDAIMATDQDSPKIKIDLSI